MCKQLKEPWLTKYKMGCQKIFLETMGHNVSIAKLERAKKILKTYYLHSQAGRQVYIDKRGKIQSSRGYDVQDGRGSLQERISAACFSSTDETEKSGLCCGLRSRGFRKDPSLLIQAQDEENFGIPALEGSYESSSEE